MVMRILLLAALLVLSGCSSLAPRDDWTKRDAMREVAFQIANAADAHTTTQIQYHPGNEELSPLTRAVLGPNPKSDETFKYFAAYGLIHYLIAKWMHPDARRFYQHFTIGLSSTAVVVNCNNDLC